MYSHANKIGQRGSQLSSGGHAIGGSGVHGGTYGNVGQSTAASHQQFTNTASQAWGKAGGQLSNQANLMHKTGQNIENAEAHNASKFHSIGGYNAPKAGGSGYKPSGGGYQPTYDPKKYQPKPKPKPKPPKPKPPKPKPQYKPNPHPFSKKAWYDNPNYKSSYETQDEFSKKYPDYWTHRNHIKSKVRPYHPEYKHIDTADLVGVRGYTTNDYYKQVNTALRNGDHATVKKYEPNIKTAVSGLNDLPRYQGWTVRKINIPEGQPLKDVLGKYKPGTQVQEDTFTSTTAGHTNSFPGNVVMHIKSRNGHPIQYLSEFPTEGEVLFGPGTRYNVSDRWQDPVDGKWHVKMSEA